MCHGEADFSHRESRATLRPMNTRRRSSSLSVAALAGALALSTLLAACGSSKSTSWAGQTCAKIDAIAKAEAATQTAVNDAKSAQNLGAFNAALSGPAQKLQDAIVDFDNTFADAKIVGTAMETARNDIGRKLSAIYKAHDGVDAGREALKTATNFASASTAIADVSMYLSGARYGLGEVKLVLKNFRLSKNKDIAKAFSNAPECKSIK